MNYQDTKAITQDKSFKHERRGSVLKGANILGVLNNRMHVIEDVNKRDRKGESNYLEGLNGLVDKVEHLNKLKETHDQKVLLR